MDWMLLGAIGGLLILSAWVFEMAEDVKHHRGLRDIRFAFLYLPGISMLLAYSILTIEPVFIWVNSTILVVVVFEVIYTLHIIRGRRAGGKRHIKGNQRS
ncbi:membrane protein [sediment metagenome]|uniref:Membrane protein n=1 Tax=sediment metagenome TaxID=749907 RepID=D9PK76_9ZZZZ